MGHCSTKCFDHNDQKNFYFRGDQLYPITKYCEICGISRFTDVTIHELSDPLLSIQSFLDKYLIYTKIHEGICYDINCFKHSYKIYTYNLLAILTDLTPSITPSITPSDPLQLDDLQWSFNETEIIDL